jgi:glycosyltransferase involved in cell wall biosynthesis
MRTLFVSNLFPPNKIGGYEELCWEVATRFAANGHDVSVLTSCYGGKVPDYPGQQIHQALRLVVGKTIYDPFDQSSFRRNAIVEQNIYAAEEALRRCRPDVIFCWNLFGLDKEFFDFLSGCGTPVVVMLTDNWLASMLNQDFVHRYFSRAVYGAEPEASFLQPTTHVRTLPDSCSAIFGAEFVRSFYRAGGVSFSNSQVIHNGVDLPAPDVGARRDLAAAGRSIRLLFVGRVVEIKGVHTAIAALADLIQERPEIDWRLSIVGDATDKAHIASLSELAAARGCTDNVEYVGWVSPEHLPRVFAEHDVFLFPSLYEPFSLTLIHAMASAIPVVASAIGGNLEIVQDGETGLLFPKGDSKQLAAAVLRLLETPDLAGTVGQEGAIEARQFSIERMVSEMDAHLRSRVSVPCPAV